MIFIVKKEGEKEPVMLATSKRNAVTVILSEMMQEGIINVESMAAVKKQLKEQGETVGQTINFYIKPTPTNTILR